MLKQQSWYREPSSVAYADACRELGRDSAALNRSSKYRGVSRHSHGWEAAIRVGGSGNRRYLGNFRSELEAARAYDDAAHAQGVGDRANFPATPAVSGVEAASSSKRPRKQQKISVRSPLLSRPAQVQHHVGTAADAVCQDDSCAICLETFNELESGTELCVLGCQHVFCYACIDEWFREGKTDCPTCRKRFASLRRCKRRKT
eukprot:COSAG01_NODE_8803_length_2654_cov_6.132681_5_plen_203_part_00